MSEVEITRGLEEIMSSRSVTPDPNSPIERFSYPFDFDYTVEKGGIDAGPHQLNMEEKHSFYGYCYFCDYALHSQNYCPLKLCEQCDTYGHSYKVCPKNFSYHKAVGKFFDDEDEVYQSRELTRSYPGNKHRHEPGYRYRRRTKDRDRDESINIIKSASKERVKHQHRDRDLSFGSTWRKQKREEDMSQNWRLSMKG